MLVLTRKSHEKICIGDDIVITILRAKGNAVRLGIEAPDSVRVLRGELAFEAREQANKEQEDEVPTGRVLHARVSRSRIAHVLPSLGADVTPAAGTLTFGVQ